MPRHFRREPAVDRGLRRRGAQGWIRCVLAPTNSRRSGLKSRAPLGELFNSLLGRGLTGRGQGDRLSDDPGGGALLQSAPDMTVRQIEGEFATVVDVLRAAASANADVEAYVDPATEVSPRRSVTFSEWDLAAGGVAGLFAECGVTRGSVVCLLLPSSIEYMICYAAAVRLGAVTSGRSEEHTSELQSPR